MHYRNPFLFSLFAFFNLLSTNLFAQNLPAASKYSVEEFFRREENAGMVLSPNGELLAATTPFKGRDNLVVVNLKDRTRNLVTSFEKYDVFNITWINNGRLLIFVADGRDVNNGRNYKGAYAVDVDGKDIRVLQDIENSRSLIRSRFSVLRTLADGSHDLIISAAQRSRDSEDVYRLNTKTGKTTLMSFDSPGKVQSWVLDNSSVPRLAQTFDEKKFTESIWYRSAEGAAWRKLSEVPANVGAEAWTPLRFDSDDKLVFVSSNQGRDKAAIVKFDPEQNKVMSVVAEDALVDISGGLIGNRALNKVIALRYEADKPKTIWFDRELESLDKQLRATFVGMSVEIALAPDNPRKALVFVHSDTNPGAYYLFDREQKGLEPISKNRPWLDPALMAERKFITYRARDGMEIPAYLTLPRGVKPEKLPLIVNVHGGPWVRAYEWSAWGRWPEAQFFASRGYAVLEPEPRASTGWGQKHYKAGFKQWGLTMQDDINDGALHLASQGIVDRSRMALHGGSYGGYATLQGLARDPELWRAGNAFIAVSDLFLFREVRFSDSTLFTDSDSFAVTIGDPAKDKELLERASPARNAAQYRVPLMLTMGSDDVRVPLIHGTKMRDALQKENKQVEWKVYTGEGHGFNKDENVLDFYSRSVGFFDRWVKAGKVDSSGLEAVNN